MVVFFVAVLLAGAYLFLDGDEDRGLAIVAVAVVVAVGLLVTGTTL